MSISTQYKCRQIGSMRPLGRKEILSRTPRSWFLKLRKLTSGLLSASAYSNKTRQNKKK